MRQGGLSFPYFSLGSTVFSGCDLTLHSTNGFRLKLVLYCILLHLYCITVITWQSKNLPLPYKLPKAGFPGPSMAVALLPLPFLGSLADVIMLLWLRPCIFKPVKFSLKDV